ncbi:hypothetical protein F5J12DRAFT_785836 [Pisolithus orientalis]|uniref:uncharacterized protein n=1 Tax=Pisolithus orientalis TaxID=936130 RepID=UPI0022245F30|nr:uncharacterized protein F5J12DRAFT_785836 [Pisolithus orientalis]KAI5994274.1 hypothetical protein F5J12DRAFT_785836 [Pisolithus orientalis]
MSDSNLVQSSTTDDINVSNTPLEENLKDNTLTIYAATPNLAACVEFFFGGTSGNVAARREISLLWDWFVHTAKGAPLDLLSLSGSGTPSSILTFIFPHIAVLKGHTNNVTELVLSGIFKIDHQEFFMGPKGGFSPKNAFSCDFADTKLTCNLLAVQHDVVYASTQCNFPLIISNIRALEKLVPLKKGESLLSSKKEDDDDPDNIACIDAMMAWPVQEDNREALNHAASTHYVSPLPVFDVDGKPIQPVDYQWVLSGAVIQVQFTLLHYFIKEQEVLSDLMLKVVFWLPTDISTLHLT